MKVFEAKNEMPSRHAGTAIGILIMQDIFAVVFLAASTGKLPSPWSAALAAGLLLVRPVLGRFMARCGHGELVMLAIPDPETSRFAVDQLHRLGFSGRIAASVRYEDEIDALKDAGIDAAYSLYEEAGTGFADHVCSEIGYCRIGGKRA